MPESGKRVFCLCTQSDVSMPASKMSLCTAVADACAVLSPEYFTNVMKIHTSQPESNIGNAASSLTVRLLFAFGVYM